LLLHLVMLVFQLASFEENNEPRIYVPKSQSSKLWTLLLPIKAWTNEMAKAIESSINNWTSSARARRKIARMHHSARRIDSSRRKGSLGVGMMAFAAVAMEANGVQSNYLTTMVTFDADSVPVGVDNRCTGCISNQIEDFEGPMVESNGATKGFGGSRTACMMIVTLAWRWMDNAGQDHKFLIPKFFCVKGGNVRLLSPQHWAQTQKDTKPIQGTGSETDARQVTLFLEPTKE
jgi:hypothetical protein